MEADGALRARRVRRAGDEIEAIALTTLRRRLGGVRAGSVIEDLAADVVDGRTDPYRAADEVVSAFREA
jgi:LAO/AO transport system kinase